MMTKAISSLDSPYTINTTYSINTHALRLLLNFSSTTMTTTFTTTTPTISKSSTMSGGAASMAASSPERGCRRQPTGVETACGCGAAKLRSNR